MSNTTSYAKRWDNTQWIKQKAQEYGFLSCGIAKAEPLQEDARRLEEWLKAGHHGEMDYMERNFDLRVDVTKLVPGAKSVISFLYNYYPNEFQNQDSYKVAKYAYGRDYHKVIKKKLKHFTRELEQQVGQFTYRFFVDSAPVMERAWARKSGLGWIGKNANLLTKKVGSFYFICEIICDLTLLYDEETKTDHCGSCTRCIDACPTEAIVEPGKIDSNKCISYLTIEYKKESYGNNFNFDNWIFGCDVCQDVCPWNRHATPNTETDFNLRNSIKHWKKQDWKTMTAESFEQNMVGSPLKRAGFEALKRNIKQADNDKESKE